MSKSAYAKEQVQKLLLPSYYEIEDDIEAVAFQHPSSAWKLLQSRACYIMLCKNNPNLRSSLVKFRLSMLEYIYENFQFIPKIAKDRIWTVSKGLLFYEI